MTARQFALLVAVILLGLAIGAVVELVMVPYEIGWERGFEHGR